MRLPKWCIRCQPTVSLLLVSMLGLLGCLAKTHAQHLVYVSNADSETITRYELDENTQSLTLLGRVAAGGKVMPLSLSPDNRYLYASIRSNPYRVITYTVALPSGELKKVGEALLPSSMANIDTDISGRYLMAVSYNDNLISISPINDNGVITQSPLHSVTTGPHAHAIHASRDNRFVLVSTLGDDKLLQFRFDQNTGRLIPNNPPSVAAAQESGPRHFVFSPDQSWVYVVSEYTAAVTTYRYDKHQGTLSLVGMTDVFATVRSGSDNEKNNQSAVNNKPDKIWAADIQITPNGRYLYISERSTSTITLLKINEHTGIPVVSGITQVETQPRSFALTKDGKFMVVAGEKDRYIGLYKIEPQTGVPAKLGRAPTDKGANWVEIVEVLD